MLTFLFLNQTLWCYHSLESSRRDDFNEGHIIGFGWEMRKLSWKPFYSLFLNCSPKVRFNLLLTSPTYFCTSSEPITLMKQASVLLATALAHSVFPVPGGPNSNTPFGGSIPKLTNFSGWKNDNNHILLSLMNHKAHFINPFNPVARCRESILFFSNSSEPD